MSNVVQFKEITEIINERKFIDEILAEGYMDRHNTIKILGKLAKHYYWDLGYKQTRTMKSLNEYMIAHDPSYKPDLLCKSHLGTNHASFYWERIFKQCYKNAKKSPICEADGIWITQAELEKISDLQDKVTERLAFVLLCYAKLYRLRNANATGWVYSNKYIDMFKQARITCKAAHRYAMLAKLEQKGYLYFYKLPAESCQKTNLYKYNTQLKKTLDARVTFVNDDSENVIFIDDWRELGYYYRRYKGENIIKCAKCGRLMRGNKNGTRKYCKSCTQESSAYQYDHKLCKCVDCGILFPVSLGKRARKRCERCAAAERKAHNREMYLKRKSQNSTSLA